MRGPRRRVEQGFEALGYALYRHPLWALLCVLVVVVAAASQLSKIRLETSFEAMLLPDNPVRVQYDAFRRQFGREEMIVIGIRPPEIFELGFLEQLRALHRDLEASVPHLEEVTSLINARSTRGEEDQLIVEDLLEVWPRGPEDLLALRERVLANPLYRGTLISDDARVTSILIETSAYSSLGQEDALAGFEDDDGFGEGTSAAEPTFITGTENSEIAHAVLATLERHSGALELYAAGSPLMITLLQEYLIRDMQRFTGLALLGIALLLFAVFRRPTGVAFPLLVVALSLICTMGALGASGIPLTFGTQMLPSFVLAVGVGYSVHVLAIFFQHFDEQQSSREEAVAGALRHSGFAILITGLTTAGGMASFSAATMLPIRSLGYFAPVGVLTACLLSLILLPALLAITPMRRRSSQRRGGTPATERLLVSVGGFGARHPVLVLAAAAVVVAAASPGLLRLGLSHDPLLWFPEDEPLRVAMDAVDRDLGGAMALEVLVRTERENGVQDPELLRRVAEMARRAEAKPDPVIDISKAQSIADIVKEIHQALNENRASHYAIPADPLLVAQELLLFEQSGSDDLEQVVDPQYRTARLTLKAQWADAIYFHPFIESLLAELRQIDGGLQIEATGLIQVMGSTIGEMMRSISRSYLIALAVIAPLMIVLLGSFRIGLASMVPNLAPIVVTLGVMGWLDIRIDSFTMLVGGVALGLVVDDTIHFMHGFRRDYEDCGDPHEAVRRTLRTTGRALLFTTVVLSLGFLLYSFSAMSSLSQFGWLTAFAVGLAFVLDILVSPALMVLLLARRGGREVSARAEVAA